MSCKKCQKRIRKAHGWRACAIGNFELCPKCDRDLNAVIVRYLNVPDADDVMARYREHQPVAVFR